MMDSLLKRIEKNRKAHIRWLAMVLCLSMIVSLGTFAGFRQTAVAKTYTKEVLDCPYTHEGASPVAHVHNDDCYDGDTLVCTLPEREAHTHTEECFAEQRRLTCVLEENPGHQHGDACYAAREENVCGLEENPGHVHNGTCFNDSGVLICTMAEGDGAHTHTADCFTTVYDLICDIPEGEGAHTHTDECYTTERVQVCGQEELPVHVHGPECIRTVEWNEGEDEPVVTDAPEESTVPEMPVSDPDADLETAEDWNREFENFELSGNWARDLILVAATQQGRGESPNNFEAFLNDAGDAWVRYGYTRYGAWYGVPYANEWSAMFVSFCLRYAGIPVENVPNNSTAALMAESFQKGELFAGRDYVPAVGDLIFFDTVDDEITNIDHMGIVYHVDAEDGTINTVEGDRTDAVATFGYTLDDEQIVGYGILPQNPNYVPTEENLNDETDGLIVMTEDTQKKEETTDTIEETVPAVPMPAQSWERTAGGIKVTVDAPEGAFPENTTIAVTPVNGNRLKDTVSDAVSGEVLEVQAVDITFFDAEGHEIEPAIPIRVSMTPAATQHAEEKTSVVHVDIAQQTAELVEQAVGTEFDNSEVVFDADAFTIYAIVYTYQVEYEYEVDGKTFTSSMPGAENMTLTQIVQGLGIVDETEIDTFVSKIASIASSNEEVAIVTENNEIRVLKDGEAKIVITMQDGAKFHIDVRAEGETSASNETATVSTVGELYLPAEAELKAEVLDEVKSESAIAAVEAQESTLASNAAAAETAYQVFDISLENVEADQYDGFQVEVKLPENVVGRDFRLFHVHDGVTTEINLNTLSRPADDTGLEVVSGFTFETKDFSEFVLSYTVDFEYTDPETGEAFAWHWRGEDSYKVSDIMAQIGVTGEISDVSLVRIVDVGGSEKVLYLEEKEDGWYLTSDEAFKDTFELTVTVDGKEYTIVITDSAPPTTNLNELLQSFSVEGATLNSDGSYTVKPGKNYKVDIVFSESDTTKQFSDNAVMTFTLPAGITLKELEPTFSVSVNSLGKQYTISGNTLQADGNSIKVKFNTNDPNFSKLSEITTTEFEIHANVEFQQREYDNPIHVEGSGDYHVDSTPDVNITKEAKLVNFDTGKVEYTLKVTSNGSNSGITVDDVISGSALTLNQDVKMYDSSNALLSPTVTYNGNSFQLKTPALQNGEYTIKYTATLDKSKLTADQWNGGALGVASDTKNDVDWTGDKHTDKDLGHIVKKPSSSKSNNGNATTDENGIATIPWKITADSNYLEDWRLREVKDTIKSEGMWYSGKGIHIKITDPTTNEVIKEDDVLWETVGITPGKDAAATTWTYDVNNFKDNENKLWKYEITYTTSYDAKNLEEQIDVKNESVTNNDPDPHTGSSTVKPPEANLTNINKYRVSVGSDKIKWHIDLSIPAKGLSAERAKVIEYLPKVSNTTYQDTYVPDSFAYVTDSQHVEADGTPNIDSTSVPGQVIFSWLHGFVQSTARRTISFEFETYVDQNWLEDTRVTTNHKNDAEFNKQHAYADAVPVKPMFKKQGSSIRKQDNNYFIDYSIITNNITESVFDPEETGSLVFTDTFDERLEYVWGSAKMYSGSDKDNIGYSTDSSYVQNVEVEGNVVTFAVKRSELPGKHTQFSDGWHDNRELQNFYKLSYTMKVKNMADLTEEALGKKNLTVLIGNSVESSLGDDEFNVEYTPDVLNKWQDGTDENGRLKFYIDVNKAKVDLSSTDDVVLTDTLTNLSAHYQNISIQVDDYDTPMTGTDENGATVTLPYFNMKGDTITFHLPDNHHVLITYYAKAVGEMGEDGNIHWKNTANLNGYEKIVENSVKYSSSASGSGTNYGVKLYKVDGYVNSQALIGAKFKLYMADVVDEEGNIVSGTPMKDLDGNDVIFETKANTDNPELVYGEVEVKGSYNTTGWNLKPEQRYYLLEVEAPEGKAIDNTKYSFVISSNGYVNYSRRAIEAPDGSGAIIEPWTYYNGDILTVKNYPKKGVIELKKVLMDTAGNTINRNDLDDDQKAAIKFVISRLNTVTGNYETVKTVGYDEFNTDSYLVADLDVGTYKVVETIGDDQYVTETVYSVNNTGDESASDLATVKISDQDVTDHTKHQVTITNTYDIPSEFKIYKYAKYGQTIVDEVTVDLKDIKLAGAEFGVFAVSGSTVGNQIGENYKTNSRGRFSVVPKESDPAHGLAYDTVYALKEVKAPEGYKLSEQVYYFCFLRNETASLPANAPAGTIGIPYKKSVSEDVPNEIGTTTVGAVKVWQNVYLDEDKENKNSVPVRIKRITSFDKAGKVVEKTEYFPTIVFNLLKDGTTWKFEKADSADVLPTGVSIDTTTGRLTGLPTMTFSSTGIPLYYNYEVEEQPVKIGDESYVPTYSIAKASDGSTTTTITNKPSSVTSSVIMKAKKKWVDDAGNDVTADMGYNKNVYVDVYRKTGMLDVGTIIDNDTTVRELADQFVLTVEGPAFATLEKNLMVCLPGDQIKVTIWPTEVGGSWSSTGSMPQVTPTASNNSGPTHAHGEYVDDERYEYIFSADPVFYRTVVTENSNHTQAMRVEIENLTAKNRKFRLSQAEAAVAGGELVQTLEISKSTGWCAQSREFPAGSGTTPFTYYMVEHDGTSYDAKYSIDDSTNTITVTNIDKKLKVDKKWFNAHGTEEIANPNGQIVYNLYQVANEATWSDTYSGKGLINANTSKLYWKDHQLNTITTYEVDNRKNIKEGSTVEIIISTTKDQYNCSFAGNINVSNCDLVSDQFITVRDDVGEMVENVSGDSYPTYYNDYRVLSHKRVIKIRNARTGFAVSGDFTAVANKFTVQFVVTGEPGDPETPTQEQLVQTKIGRVTMTKDNATVVFDPAFEDANIKVAPGATDWSSVITNLPETGAAGITYTYYITEEAVEGFELMSIDTVPASAASTVVIKNKKEPSGNLTVKKVVSGATGQKSKAFKVTVTTFIHDDESDTDVTWYAKEDGTLTTEYTELTVSQNQELLIEELPLGSYTVTEIVGTGNANVQIDGHYFVSKESDPEDGSVTFIRSDMDKTVTLTNTYEKAVDVTKYWGEGVTPREPSDPVYFALYQSDKGSTETLTEVTNSEQAVSVNTAWKASWRSLDFEKYDYYVIEYVKVGGNKVYDGQTGWPYETLVKYGTTNLTAVQKDGKNFYHIGEFVQDSTTFKFSSLSATNNNLPGGNLKLIKTLTMTTGTKPDPAKVFYFTVSDGTNYYYLDNGSLTSTTTAPRSKTDAGVIAVTSDDTDGVLLQNLALGEYTVTELDFEREISGYKLNSTTYKVDDGEAAEDPCKVTVESNTAKTVETVNTYSEVVDIEATKTWKNGEETVTTSLLNATVTLTLEKSTDGNTWTQVAPTTTGEVNPKTIAATSTALTEWKASWTNLPKYDGNTLIQYRVIESDVKVNTNDSLTAAEAVVIVDAAEDYMAVSGSNSKATGEVFNTLPSVDLEVNKAWAPMNIWPDDVESVTVQLQQSVNSGTPTDVTGKTLTITPENSALTQAIVHDMPETTEEEIAAKKAAKTLLDQRFFLNLPKYDDKGNLITYSAVETTVTGTTVTLKDFNVSYNPESTTTDGVITVTNTLSSISLDVIKVAKGTSTRLHNAEFQMTRKNSSGSYEVFENEMFAEDTKTGKKTGPFSVGSTGEITITNLFPGHYNLKETKAPDGYIIVTDGFEFTINIDGTVTVTGRTADEYGNITYSDTNNLVTFKQKTDTASVIVTIENTPGTALPQTGGIGTTLFTALGGLMTATAGAILTMKSYRRRKQNA